MENYCIYIHTNKVNRKVYIGMTKDVKKRWSGNGTQYNRKDKKNTEFGNDIDKYGWNNFEHEIIEDNLTFENARIKEKYYIDYFKEHGLEVYNIAEGGIIGGHIYNEHPKGMLGKKQTDFQKESHKKWASEKENNCMTNGQVIWGVTHEHPKGFKGKKHSEEEKRKIAESMIKNSVNKKSHIVIFQDGRNKKFESLREISEYFNVSRNLITRIVNSNKPYELSKSARKTENLKNIVGISIIRDNTEVSQ